MSAWVEWMEFELQRQNLRKRIFEKYVENEKRKEQIDEKFFQLHQQQKLQQQQQQQHQHQQQQQQQQQDH